MFLVARLVLGLCLVGSLSVRPIVEQLHYLFASHGHRYCPDHQRVEDVPRTHLRLAGAPQPEGPGDPQAAPGDSYAGLAFHVACSVLNGPPAFGTCGPADCPWQAECVEYTTLVAPSARSFQRALCIWRLAPKRSPPMAG